MSRDLIHQYNHKTNYPLTREPKLASPNVVYACLFTSVSECVREALVVVVGVVVVISCRNVNVCSEHCAGL